MKKLLLYSFIMLFIYSCQKREYRNDYTYCVYKNFISPDTIPCTIDKLIGQISFHSRSFNNIIELNAFYYADSTGHKPFKVNDTLSVFLDHKYTEACYEKELDIVGMEPDANTYFNIYHVKNYYYCGSIPLQLDVNSLVFLNSYSDRDFRYSDLILFNIKNKKLVSLIKLSSFAMEASPRDVSLRTFIVNDLLISIKSPPNEDIESERLTLKTSNNNLSYIGVPEGIRKKIPFTYYLFRVRNTGYIALLPTFVDANQIELLGNECDYHSLRFEM